jgi:type IV pilus assembly protein PilQ
LIYSFSERIKPEKKRDDKMKKLINMLVIILLLTPSAFSQKYLEKAFKYTNPEELVTLSANLPFNKAIDLLSKVSEKITGKKIVCMTHRDDPIGIELKNMTYDKALVIIVQYANLIYEEREDVIVVKKKNEVVETPKDPANYAPISAREVKISAVFFEMNTTELKKRGINWQFLLSGQNLDMGGKTITTPTDQSSSGSSSTTTSSAGFDFNVSSSKLDFGGFFGQATAVFKFFETNNLGELIASPTITVRDQKEGRIQVGSDFSIKQKDFAGNVTDAFFSTGAIIRVTPYVFREDSLDYVMLKLEVERSSATPSTSMTEVKKTSANTQVLLLNGEETIIGGLYSTEESKVRNGIPFLKDLPWWVLGIRYLTGNDETTLIKKELVILIKAELLPSLKDRFANPVKDKLIEKEINTYRDKIKYYQFNQAPNEQKGE